MEREGKLGATYLGSSRCSFCVWAPFHDDVKAHITSPVERFLPLTKDHRGYFSGTFDDVIPGSLYKYRVDNEKECPDPASRFQPHGVHGPSQVTDSYFDWDDSEWKGTALTDYILYELHVGAFTSSGTFDAVIEHLDRLKELGITALEIMPVAQFPGGRNWGYDGVYPFAVQDTYGGPLGLKRLVSACHRSGLAILLDVVYNHLGPEGNCLREFGPYFTDRYRTPWGSAMNFDGPNSDEVRRLFIENALYWIEEFHFDGLRVDAIHGIVDQSAQPFLQELATQVHEEGHRLQRQVFIIAESDLNDTRVLRPHDIGGFGYDAQWNDDFHHSVHALLTGERGGYYSDFGETRDLVKAWQEGFVYSGQYSRFRRRRHGNSSRDIPAHELVVAIQNHDQVGNRMLGERLSQLISFEDLKLAAGMFILSPFVPLLFMGEEWGETAPFLYFISHSDPGLVEAVRQGRREEFADFAWQGEPPDPQDEATFLRSKINHNLRDEGHHRTLLDFYKELIGLRKENPTLTNLDKSTSKAKFFDDGKIFSVLRSSSGSQTVLLFNVTTQVAGLSVPLLSGRWRKLLDSSDQCWEGPGSHVPKEIVSDGAVELQIMPRAFVVLDRQKGN